MAEYAMIECSDSNNPSKHGHLIYDEHHHNLLMYLDLASLEIIGQTDWGYGQLYQDQGTDIQTTLTIYLQEIAQKHHTTTL